MTKVWMASWARIDLGAVRTRINDAWMAVVALSVKAWFFVVQVSMDVRAAVQVVMWHRSGGMVASKRLFEALHEDAVLGTGDDIPGSFYDDSVLAESVPSMTKGQAIQNSSLRALAAIRAVARDRSVHAIRTTRRISSITWEWMRRSTQKAASWSKMVGKRIAARVADIMQSMRRN